MSGDFNGDGYDDVAFIYDYTWYANVLVFTASGGNLFNQWSNWHSGKRNYTFEGTSGRTFGGDYDGDGIDELISLSAESSSSLSINIWKTKSSKTGFDYIGNIWNSENMVTSDDAATTTLVSKMTNGSDYLEYTYDKLGNITEVKENGKTIVTYHYDSLGQLVREDIVGDYTYVYSYDNGGNILSKKTYKYTYADVVPTGDYSALGNTYTYGNG